MNMTKELFIDRQTQDYLQQARDIISCADEESFPDCVADSSYLKANAASLAENDWEDYRRMWAQQTKSDFYKCFTNW